MSKTQKTVMVEEDVMVMATVIIAETARSIHVSNSLRRKAEKWLTHLEELASTKTGVEEDE